MRRLALLLLSLVVVGGCSADEPSPTDPPAALRPCDEAYDGRSDERLPPTGQPPPADGWVHAHCLQLTLSRTPGWEQVVQAVVLSDRSADPLEGRRLLVYHPGGPGISAVARLLGQPPAVDPARYAVLAWDGATASTTPGACGPATITFLGERTVEDFADAALPAAEECDVGYGSAAELGAWAAAEELEELRVVLGVESVDLLTQSYGTAIAEAYLRMYPERVGRAVLDAPFGLEVGWLERAEAVSNVLRQSVGELARSCTTAACVEAQRGADGPAAYDALRRIILDRPPAVGSGSLGLTPVMLDQATLLALRHERHWPGYAAAVDEALAGDGTALYRIAERLFLDLDWAVFYRSICADMDRPARAADYLLGRGPLLFAYTSELAPCAGFPRGEPRPAGELPAAQPEVLLVASPRDILAPAAMIATDQSLMRLGALCITHVNGHTGYHDETVRDLVHEFLAGADAAAIAARCRGGD